MEEREKMSSDEQERVKQVKGILGSFLKEFNEYAEEVKGEHRHERLNDLRTRLLRQEPQVTQLILEILGEGQVDLGSRIITHRGMLAVALMGGISETDMGIRLHKAPATMLLNRALGAIETGLWPLKEPRPVLVIKDAILRERCSDLLRAPGKFDRVLREATTVLDDRIRSKASVEVLARLIPKATEQFGENLVTKLFSPKNPVLVISNAERERKAFHLMLLGVFAYLRNPYHHQLDDTTEWSWAWSTVGLIDRLLADVESCTVSDAGFQPRTRKRKAPA